MMAGGKPRRGIRISWMLRFDARSLLLAAILTLQGAADCSSAPPMTLPLGNTAADVVTRSTSLGSSAGRHLLQTSAASTVGRYYCGSPAVPDPYTPTASWTPVNSTTLLSGAPGFITPAPISLSEAFQFVYQTSCVGPVVKVAFPVPAPGNYIVTIMFAEPYWTRAGRRVFDVAVESALLLDNFDVIGTVGSAFTAYNASFVVSTSDRTVALTSTASVDQAMFSGIIISTAPDLPPPPATSAFGVYLYCGSLNFRDAAGKLWRPLKTSPYVVNPPGVAVGIQYGGAITGAGGLLRVFRSECVGSPTILVPVPSNGWYAVTLHTAENYWTLANKRKFSVVVEGLTELPAYDIFADVGAHAAVNKTFYTKVTDGDILINLVSIVDQSSFGGISIVPYTPSGPTDPALQSPPAPTPPPVLPPTPPKSPPPPRPAGLVFQMYCGSGPFFDAWGGIWADNTAVQLTSVAGIFGVGATIQNSPPELQRVYQSECASPLLTFAIPVPSSGEYDVTILNHESYWDSAGRRVFTITAEGSAQVTNLDLWTASGGKYIAYNTSFRIPVSDGVLNLRMAASVDNARFSGIVVSQAATANPPPAPTPPPATPPPPPPAPPDTPPPSSTGTATWCGSEDYLDPTTGQLWQSRAFFTGAAFSPVFPGGISGSSAELRPIYAAECVAPDYSVTFSGLAAGDYTVTIMAAETYFTTAGARVFSITIQDVQVLSAVDLYTLFGPVAAGNFTYVVPAVTSTITFRFTASANQARIGGILVRPGRASGAPVITPAATPTPAPPAGNPVINPPVQVPQDTSLAALSLNFNGGGFTDARGNAWVPVTPYINLCGRAAGAAVQGATADLQPMLTTECSGEITITIPVQVTGTYTLRFWNAEIFWGAANQRVFDVLVSGQRVIQNWDIWKETGGKLIAQFKEVTVPITSANIVINLRAVAGADQPTIKGLQLLYVSSSTFSISSTPPAYSFQLVDPVDPQNNKQSFTLQALLPTSISGIRVVQLQPDVYPDQPVFVFTVPLGGSQQAVVDTATTPRITFDTPRSLARGGFLNIEGTFLPRSTSFYSARLEIISGVTVIGAVTLDGTGDLEANNPHILHVVADGARSLVDVDTTNRLPVLFDATSSHTHDPARRIVRYQWTNTTNGRSDTISTAVNCSAVLPEGSYTWNLTIFDDGAPVSSKTDVVAFTIYPPTAVPGTFVKYFSTSAAPTVTSSLTGVAPLAASRMPGFWLVAPVPSRVAAAVVQIQMKGTRTFPAGATLNLAAGADGHALTNYRMLVDGQPVTSGGSVQAGRHSIELRAVIDMSLDVPLTVKAGDQLLNLTAGITYDESVEGPVINTISPSEGIVLGGTRITVQGYGWKRSDLQVLIGTTVVRNSQITQITANSFYFLAPAVSGPSTFPITITSKGKTSNALPYAYLAADQPVPDFRVTPFQYADTFRGISCGQWCHGRFFFAGTSGILYEVSFNDDYTVMTSVKRYEQLASDPRIPGKLVLGLTCNPHEPSERFKIWLAHSDLFDPVQDPTNPGFKGKSDYTAAIGYFQWPEMDAYRVAVDNLPCATAFHSVASLTFDNQGLLYCGVGALTNSGAPAPRFGNLPESPWSSGMLRADVENPEFTGHIKYEFRPDVPAGTVAGKAPDDQRWSAFVQTMRNSTRGLEMYAYGMRNPLGLTFHTNGNLYTCDNGPNADSGPALLSPFNYSTEYVGTAYDRIDLIERFSYHGIGNENRALQGDIRQGTYIAREPTDKYYRPSFSSTSEGLEINYTQPIGLVLSSSNGMDEYRSDAFLGALRGQLVISKLASFLYFVKLSADGRTVVDIKQDSDLNLPVVPALKAITGPYGAIIGIDFGSNTLRVLAPVDTAATLAGLTYIYDIFPWRVPRTWPDGQSFPFVLSGANFQNLETPVTVKFGGVATTNATVTGRNTIRGTIPQSPGAPDALVDVEVVTNSGSSFKIARAFRYLAPYAPVFSGPPGW